LIDKLLILKCLLFRGDELDMTTKLKKGEPGFRDPYIQRLLIGHDRLRHAKF